MTGVEVEWSVDGRNFRLGGGQFGSNVEEGFGEYIGLCPQPIPNQVAARWKTYDGKQHTRCIEVASHVPDIEHFTGTIVFKFYDDDVVVVPVPRWLEIRNSRLGKTTVP